MKTVVIAVIILISMQFIIYFIQIVFDKRKKEEIIIQTIITY